jgi:hypothetical protein
MTPTDTANGNDFAMTVGPHNFIFAFGALDSKGTPTQHLEPNFGAFRLDLSNGQVSRISDETPLGDAAASFSALSQVSSLLFVLAASLLLVFA